MRLARDRRAPERVTRSHHGVRRPNQDTAAKFHSARNQAFTAWAEVTGVAMAA
jgi:hypothetical protein